MRFWYAKAASGSTTNPQRHSLSVGNCFLIVSQSRVGHCTDSDEKVSTTDWHHERRHDKRNSEFYKTSRSGMHQIISKMAKMVEQIVFQKSGNLLELCGFSQKMLGTISAPDEAYGWL